jgi:large subunit ribosomal protein L33
LALDGCSLEKDLSIGLEGNMAKKSEARVIISLACTECQERNYGTVKNKRSDAQRLELKKYCPRDRKHTLHRETK